MARSGQTKGASRNVTGFRPFLTKGEDARRFVRHPFAPARKRFGHKVSSHLRKTLKRCIAAWQFAASLGTIPSAVGLKKVPPRGTPLT